jgi:hypothetical protein
MSRQRSTLVDIKAIEPEVAEKQEAPSVAPEDPNARRKVSLYIKQAHYRTIRRAAADRDMLMQDVVEEALVSYFKANGYQT